MSQLLEEVSHFANMRGARAVDAFTERLAFGCIIDAARKSLRTSEPRAINAATIGTPRSREQPELQDGARRGIPRLRASGATLQR